MNRAINFYELRKQLEELGFTDPHLPGELRNMVAGEQLLHDLYTREAGAYSGLTYRKQEADGYQLYGIGASMDVPGKADNQVMQYYQLRNYSG